MCLLVASKREENHSASQKWMSVSCQPAYHSPSPTRSAAQVLHFQVNLLGQTFGRMVGGR